MTGHCVRAVSFNVLLLVVGLRPKDESDDPSDRGRGICGLPNHPSPFARGCTKA